MSLFTGTANAPTGGTYSGSAPADTPEITIPFTPRRIVLTNEDATNAAFVSFGGNDPAGAAVDQVRLPASSTVTLEHTQGTGIFLRAPAGTPSITVNAES